MCYAELPYHQQLCDEVDKIMDISFNCSKDRDLKFHNIFRNKGKFPRGYIKRMHRQIRNQFVFPR